MRPPEAAYYCGMGRTVFDREIRPLLPEILIGGQGVGFDRVDLDRVLDDYKSRNVLKRDEEKPLWENPKSPDFIGTKKQAKEK